MSLWYHLAVCLSVSSIYIYCFRCCPFRIRGRESRRLVLEFLLLCSTAFIWVSKLFDQFRSNSVWNNFDFTLPLVILRTTILKVQMHNCKNLECLSADSQLNVAKMSSNSSYLFTCPSVCRHVTAPEPLKEFL